MQTLREKLETKISFDSFFSKLGSEGSSGSAATGSSQLGTGTAKKSKLTIELPTKIDTELSKKRFYKHRPSQKVIVVKWISTFVMAALLLAFVTQSKVSVIAISENMNRQALSGDATKTQEACRQFVMLLLLVLIPNCLNFIRGVWGGLFRKDIPWPRPSAFLLVSGAFFLPSFFRSSFFF